MEEKLVQGVECKDISKMQFVPQKAPETYWSLEAGKMEVSPRACPALALALTI